MVYQNSLILTIHNKEKTIIEILRNLINLRSEYSNRIILIFDGCTDKSYELAKEFAKNISHGLVLDFVITNDIWETKANNVGLKMVDTKYATIVQDDMLIKQRNWDKTLIDNFRKYDLFAVSIEQVMNSILKREI